MSGKSKKSVSAFVKNAAFAIFAVCAAITVSSQASQMRIQFTGYDEAIRPGAATLTDFPALVVFTNNINNTVFTFENAPFADPPELDLQFFDENITPLDYEIDTYVPGVKLAAWVKVPELKPDGLTWIRAVWGDTGGAYNPSAVWDDEYLLVHHYNETNGLAIADSTSAKRPGAINYSGTAVSASEYPGVVGNALTLSASTTTSGVRMNPPLAIGPAWTVSAWFKGLKDNTANDSWRTLTRASPASGQHHIIVDQKSNKLGTYSPNGLGIYNGGNFPSPAAFHQAPNAYLERDLPQEWRHIMVVGENGTTTFYIDGEPCGDTANFQAIQDIEGIGSNQQGGTASQQFADYLDEFRVASVGRSADWAWAEYENQKPDSFFAAYMDAPMESYLTVAGTPPGMGAVSPSFGLHGGYASGQKEYAFAYPAWTNAAGNVAAYPVGWEIFADNGSGFVTTGQSGTTTNCTYTHAGVPGKILWSFTTTNKLQATAAAGGSVSSPFIWCGENDSAQFTALPDVGMTFNRWTGDVPPGADIFNPVITLPGAKPISVQATFFGMQHVVMEEDGGDDDNSGTTFADAKATIQAAVDELRTNAVYGGVGVVVVSNGVYGVQSEIYISSAVAVRGYTGVPEDVIVQRDGTAGDTRVFHLNNADARIEFLTVNGGNLGAYNQHGANIYINAGGGTVADCVVRNGRVWNGYSSGGNIFMNSANALVLRCVVTNGVSGGNSNGGGGGGFRIDNGGGRVEQCLIAYNSDNGSGMGSAVMMGNAGIVANCTIARNWNAWNGAVNVNAPGAGQIVNCVIVDNTSPNNPDPANGGTVFCGAAQAARFQNCVADVFVNPTCFAGVNDGDFGFVDRAAHDYHLTPYAPALDKGAAFALVSATDLERNPRVVNGAVDIGCYEYQFNGDGGNADTLDFHFDTFGERRHAVPFTIVVTGAVMNAKGTVQYAWNFGDGSPTIFTSEPTVTYTYLVPSMTEYTITGTATDSFNGAFVIRSRGGFLAAPDVIHVAPGAANEDYPFDSWATALASPVAALPYTENGTVILVSNGVYNCGYGYGNGATALDVTKGVTIRGLTGVPEDVTFQGPSYRVQLMMMSHPLARLEHITLRGGDAYYSAYLAGNLHIGPLGGTVTNCVITGGQATHGNNAAAGGVHMGGRDALLTHCVIRNNSAGAVNTMGAGVEISAGRLDNCLIAENWTTAGSDGNHKAGGLYMTGGAVVNCTIAGNTSRNFGGLYATGGVLTNVVVAGNTSTSYSIDPVYHEPETWGGSIDTNAFVNCATENPAPVNPTCFAGSAPALLANVPAGDYYPAAGSPCVDNGFPLANPPAIDLDGNPRVQGDPPALDIGCFESNPGRFTISFSADNVESLAPTQAVFTVSVSGDVNVEDLDFYWDFNGDGRTDLFTRSLCVTNPYPLGGFYTVTLVATNNAPSSPSYLTARQTIANYLHYCQKTLYVVPGNPIPPAVRPYSSWETAAPTINDAITMSVDGCEIIFGKGTHITSGQLFISKTLDMRGDTGKPGDVVIQPPDGANYSLVKFDNPAAKLSGVTLHGGRYGAGGGNLDFDTLGGTVSNCVIRSGESHSYHGTGAAAQLSSANAL
ncbi:MAG: PKD domain-containing protein, partial [Kiritimatiellaeota bacterium]|nr:PKD domain-containing protein [Kiritimatiellota bacterium]